MANETKTESNKVPPLKRKQKKDLAPILFS
jgi:hypothetical protein